MPASYQPDETELTADLAAEVLFNIRSGKVPAQFCDAMGIDDGAPERWAAHDESFAKQYEAAKRLGADAMMNYCIFISDSNAYKADAKKIMIETRTKIASLWYPDKYGAKAEKDPVGSIQALVNVPYNELSAAKKAAVDKFFGTDEDDV